MLQIKLSATEEHELLSQIAMQSKRHWNYPEELIQLWKDDLTISAKYIDTHLVFSARLNNEIIGLYAIEEVTKTKCELSHFWLLPEHIGQGFGKQLFQHMIEQAKLLGYESVKIISDPNAAPFYENMGAVKIGTWESLPKGRFLPVYRFEGF